jgi:DNA-binding response OmpR family regulator
VFQRLKAEWPRLAGNLIFMTGGAFSPESREFLQRSPQPVLTKPFSADELRAVVRTLLGDGADGHN